MTKTRQSVLLIGGGIAGNVAAIALHEVGIPAKIFESRDAASDGVGAFLTLATNGLAALEAVGIEPARLGGIPSPRMAMFLGDGRPLLELEGSRPTLRGALTRTIKRGELYASLRAEALRRGIPIAFGKKLVEAAATPADTVMARFADGSSEEGRLLVGADGLHSRLRRIIDPAAPAPRYLGLLNTGGFARGVTVPGEPGTMRMIFGKRCFFGYLPGADGEVWWFANPARRKEPAREEVAAMTSDDWRAELLALFADDVGPATEVIRATDEIFAGWGTYDLPRVPRWHRDRLLIIGDAAHAAAPSSGQGAAMAMEDGVVLARCLRDGSDDGQALVAFEAERRPRVERVVAMGRRNGSGKTPGWFGRPLRDLALRFFFARMQRRPDPRAWLFDHRVTLGAPAATTAPGPAAQPTAP